MGGGATIGLWHLFGALVLIAVGAASTPLPLRAEDPTTATLEDELPDSTFVGGSELPVDKDLNELQVRADLLAADGRGELSAIIWSRMLTEESVQQLWTTGTDKTVKTASHSYRVSRPIVFEIHQRLSASKEARNTFRKHYDNVAEKLLADKAGEALEDAQRQVVREYFSTSVGDDAAFALARTSTARGDLAAGLRLLRAPGIPAGEISPSHPRSSHQEHQV